MRCVNSTAVSMLDRLRPYAISTFAAVTLLIWGNRVFITTAVQLNDAQPVFKSGPEGSSTAESANRSTKDDVPHSWRVYGTLRVSAPALWSGPF